jgi:hypothetical protein
MAESVADASWSMLASTGCPGKLVVLEAEGFSLSLAKVKFGANLDDGVETGKSMLTSSRAKGSL